MMLKELVDCFFSAHNVEQQRALWTDEELLNASLRLEQPIESPKPAVSLDEYLTSLIAAEDGVSPETVTVEYIREQREHRFYPSTRYNIGSSYGGYDGTGLKFLTQEEFEALDQRLDAELAKI